MKINMINSGITADTYVRDLPKAFVYYADNEPHSVWKSIDINMDYSVLSLHGVRSFISFFLNGNERFEVIVLDKVMKVDEVFNFDHDGNKIVPVSDMEIAELNVKF